ncbi:flagellar hook protein FlgE [Phenylobacterium montanum]|uniref:Flagellar hook protein FlgE n=1 Tax=Phenylobacterium montanum TaxID=2823693 RepID=A0A975G3C3_9CAUL|nr:flagellar hook protein FlgE [Caulobacter sp. S6]QUD90034.1 flagellar hook protein FlgE [Caulobacter sp. S6]
MSLTSAMLAGVTGLSVNSSDLSAISDNIANVNTVGYKRNGVNFEDLVTQSDNTGTYTAGGVSSVNQQYVSAQGAIQQTASPTDLAITGQGMFVTTQTPTTIGATTAVLFTRAGSFTPDSEGYLRNSAGLYLQAYPANAQGVIQSQSSSLSSLQPINVDSIGGAVSASTKAGVNANMNAAQAVSTQAQDAALVTAGTATAAQTAAAYNAASNSMTAYDATTGTGVQPDFSIQVPISDSEGGQHNIQIDLLKSSTANTWYAEIQSVPTSDIPAVGANPQGQIAAGTVTFNSDGSLASVNLTDSSGNPVSGGLTPTLNIPWAASLGVTSPQPLSISLSPGVATSGLTQYSGSSAVQSISTDGTPFGQLSSVAINSTGDITATFSNGTNRVIGQVALATFPNVDGLTSVSGDAYVSSTTSGAYSLKTPGTGGAGTISSSALESSTVDLSAEFANMIITQRAYSASSKIITTADQMTQDLLQIIR